MRVQCLVETLLQPPSLLSGRDVTDSLLSRCDVTDSLSPGRGVTESLLSGRDVNESPVSGRDVTQHRSAAVYPTRGIHTALEHHQYTTTAAAAAAGAEPSVPRAGAGAAGRYSHDAGRRSTADLRRSPVRAGGSAGVTGYRDTGHGTSRAAGSGTGRRRTRLQTTLVISRP